jgi:hypothetical protein
MTTKTRLSQLAVLTVALSSYGAAALATLCGDDVGGRDVPCACGDTVVSDLTLSGDPIAADTCVSDGLIVRALDATAAITIDLAGHTLQGKGNGTGILVIYGGPGGARIVSSGTRATIEEFRDGVSAHGGDSLSALEDVIVLRSARDGVRVHADGYQVRNVDARASGRDGFAIMGSRFRVVGTLAGANARNGYFVMGRNGMLGLTGQENAARGNGAAGFMIGGDTHQIADCIASMNNKEGLHLFGDGHDVIDCQSDDNLGDGFMGMGNRWRVGGNSASNNGGNGIYIRGPNLTDLGRNVGRGNGSLIAPPRTVVECEINGVACRQ